MRRLASAVAAVVVSTGLAACGGGTPVSPSGLNGSGSRFSLADSTGSGVLTDADATFANWAAQMNSALVALGGLAAQNGDTQEVKFFGAQLAQTHRTATDQLMQATGDTVGSTRSMGDAQATYDRLYRLSGSGFDRAFVPAIIQLHQSIIARMRSQGSNAASNGLQQYTREVLPDLQQHLAMARDLAGRVGVELPSSLQ